MILAISAALVLPRLGDSRPSQLQAAAELLAADLAIAQIESISHGDDPRMVFFDIDDNRYRVEPSSTPGTAIEHPIDHQPFVVRFGEGRATHLPLVQLSAFSLDGDARLGFGAWGQLDQTTTATMTLTAGLYEITVSIDPLTGEASIGPLVRN